MIENVLLSVCAILLTAIFIVDALHDSRDRLARRKEEILEAGWAENFQRLEAAKEKETKCD